MLADKVLLGHVAACLGVGTACDLPTDSTSTTHPMSASSKTSSKTRTRTLMRQDMVVTTCGQPADGQEDIG
jgi:hypothetical protein